MQERAKLLEEEHPRGQQRGVGRLFIGDCLSALHWAGIFAGYIINCYNEDSPFHPFCVRTWLNIGHRGEMSGVSWQARLEHAVKMVFGALLHGENVLVHCFRGRHRSGAFAIFCLALIMGWDLETARDAYFTRRPDFDARDHAIVQKVLDHRGGLQGILEEMRMQDWCQHAVKVLVTMSRVPELKGCEEGLIPFNAPPCLPPEPARIVAPKARPSKKPRTSEGSSFRRPSSVLRPSSSSGLAPSSSVPRPSSVLRPSSSSVPRPSTSFNLHQINEEEAATYKITCEQAGVWAQVEENVEQAAEETQSKEEPTIELESPPEGAWVCSACTSWVSRHKLYCSRVGCPTRRELMQKWKPGDYFCTVCGNHRFKESVRCQWVHCHSNDWVCPNPACGNLNYSARRFCHTRWCWEPRPFDFGRG